MDVAPKVDVERYRGNRREDVVETVYQIDDPGDAEADPHERVPEQSRGRVGELQRQLDDGEGKPLAIRPERPEDDRQADQNEDEHHREARPPEDGREPGLQNLRLVERARAVPVSVEDVLVRDDEPARRGAVEHLIPLVLRGGEPVAGRHEGDEHLEHVVRHDGGADGEHHIDDDQLSAVEGDARQHSSQPGVGERDEHEDDDDVEEERDGGDEGAVAADALQVEDPERIHRQQQQSRQYSSPDPAIGGGLPHHRCVGLSFMAAARSGRGAPPPPERPRRAPMGQRNSRSRESILRSSLCPWKSS